MDIFLSVSRLCCVDQMVAGQVTEQQPGPCHLVMESSIVRWSKEDGDCGGTGFPVSTDASFLNLALHSERSPLSQ